MLEDLQVQETFEGSISLSEKEIKACAINYSTLRRNTFASSQ
jgi:hypothetical protein